MCSGGLCLGEDVGRCVVGAGWGLGDVYVSVRYVFGVVGAGMNCVGMCGGVWDGNKGRVCVCGL